MTSGRHDVQPLRLLIVDDHDDDARLIARHLGRSGLVFEWTWAASSADLDEALRGPRPFDVVLTDHKMPVMTSQDVLDRLAAMPDGPPCVIVSGAIGEEVAVQAMQAGASDYVSKDNPARLPTVIRRAVEQAAAQRARVEAERRLRSSERHLRRLIDTAEEGICELDAEGRVTFVNRRLGELLGFEPSEMVGAYAREWLAPASLDELRTAMGAPQDGERRRLDLRLRDRNGRELWAIVSIRPTVDANGSYSGMLAMVTDISDRKAMEQELQQHALHDAVTGLPNRVLFMDRLAHALATAERDCTEVALIFIDLDDFKHVNDTFGHELGDELLKGVAARLASVLRPQDTVSRFAGDEFTVLCPGVSNDGAVRIATRIQSALAEAFTLGAQEAHVNASLGIAWSIGLDKSAEALVHEADTAMYRAKEIGGGRVETFDENLRESVARRVRIERGLQEALRDEKLDLAYQPIVCLEDGEIAQFEALLRWQHPELGAITPGEFVPIAEETGLIVEVGRWVAREAFRGLASATPRGLGISINLSARQLLDPGLATFLVEEALNMGIPPQTVHLEITETMLVGDRKAILDMVAALKEAGFRLVLDDFGTGYSAISYLKRLPFDLIKIDRSFIVGLGNGGRDNAIVTAIVGVADALDLDVIAEGVETREQAECLATLGVEYGQGYLFAPPVCLSEVPQALAGATLV